MTVNSAAVLALVVTTIATPASAWAFTGVGGCTSLPEYYRAVGALQGMTSACNMTIEEARRIVAAYGSPTVYQQVVPEPRPAHRRHHPAQRP